MIIGRWVMVSSIKIAIFIDETITHRPIIIRHLGFKGPQSFFHVATGGLGQGLGIALGTKLALKDRLVVSVIGDGSFMYNPVTQSFASPGCT